MALYKLGKLPPVKPARLSDLAIYASGKPPAPPASIDVPNASYPMDGNDRLGDCTIAGVAHLISAWNVEVNENDVVPAETDVVNTYLSLSGGQDTGLAEYNVLQTWYTNGLFGHQIAGFAPVNPHNIVAIQQAIAFYGGCYFGIECPQSAQEQFQAGQAWTFVPGSPVAGGHCIVGLGYTPTAVLCATWGGIAEVTYSFLAHFLEESWAIIPHQFVEAGQDAFKLDLATLKADLSSLSA